MERLINKLSLQNDKNTVYLYNPFCKLKDQCKGLQSLCGLCPISSIIATPTSETNIKTAKPSPVNNNQAQIITPKHTPNTAKSLTVGKILNQKHELLNSTKLKCCSMRLNNDPDKHIKIMHLSYLTYIASAELNLRM
ncbi:hypothetical protein COBT_002662 [Conglomerata obtusa]